MGSDTNAFPRLKLVMLLAATLAAGATAQQQLPMASTRGAALVFSNSNNRRRHLLQESTCTLFRKCVSYPGGHHGESWVCRLSDADSNRLGGVRFVDLIESEAIVDVIANATGGSSTLSVSSAMVDAEDFRMFVPESAHVRVSDTRDGMVRIGGNQEANRDLTTLAKNSINTNKAGNDDDYCRKCKGTLQTLVVRVTDRNGVAPTANAQKMINDVFEDEVSLKTQTQACSYNKLKIEPFRGTTPSGKYIGNGILEVTMDFDMNSGDGGMVQKAEQAAEDAVGDLDDFVFDLVMFCFPPGDYKDIAWAYPNAKYSFYKDEWCGYVDAQMHEVGHNLGLAHSGQPFETQYGDVTGYMGSSVGKDDYRQCYNPQKSYQLGWYEDQVETVNPLDDGKDRREFTLNGVSDYGKNKESLIVLRLLQANSEQDFYVGYNRATGINRDTSEDSNRVTVIRKEYGKPHQYGQSTKLAALAPGQSAFLENFDGSGKTIQVAFVGITESGDARIMVLEGREPPYQDPYCQKFTVEVVTDDYPGDNSWYFVDREGWGRVPAASVPFTEQKKEYRQEICLPQDRKAKTYKFAIEDTHGDNMGGGGYRVFDQNQKLLFAGGDKFSKDQRLIYHDIQVDGNPNVQPTAPPTQYPTPAPTPLPPCREYTVEVKTDGYPQDTTWRFVRKNSIGDEVVDAQSPLYDDQHKFHSNEVCLYKGYDYAFVFYDIYGDGLGKEGYYKLTENCSGKVLVDSGENGGKFEERSHPFTVPANGCNPAPPIPSPTANPLTSPPAGPPTGIKPPPTSKPTKKPKCKNTEKKKFQLTKKKKKKRKCKQYAKKKQCGKKIETGKHKGKLVQDVCEKSCKVCKK